ncbi:aromatic-ring hydroxylase C-terminal domain-containing protein [Streptomyces marincola]
MRPDGHTAWLRTTDDDHLDGLRQALRHWHGPAAPSAAASTETSP